MREAQTVYLPASESEDYALFYYPNRSTDGKEWKSDLKQAEAIVLTPEQYREDIYTAQLEVLIEIRDNTAGKHAIDSLIEKISNHLNNTPKEKV